jgi:hypothetical protein
MKFHTEDFDNALKQENNTCHFTGSAVHMPASVSIVSSKKKGNVRTNVTLRRVRVISVTVEK